MYIYLFIYNINKVIKTNFLVSSIYTYAFIHNITIALHSDLNTQGAIYFVNVNKTSFR